MTDTRTMTIVEFLEARLAEDELSARMFTKVDDSTAETEYAYLSARRVLREVEAKRRVVALHCESHWCVGDPSDVYDDWEGNPCLTLRALASVYADHPDYDPAWAV